MGFFGFGNKKEGAAADCIRCDVDDYIIWKWSPDGLGGSKKENAIRFGSKLRVKDGEVAVFVYKQSDETMQEFIEGPFDKTLETANLPILSNLLGKLYGGGSPFQAEVYFINLAENIPFTFAFRDINIADNRSDALSVPTFVKGSIIFNISNYKEYIKVNRMKNFDMQDLRNQAEEFIKGTINESITNAISAYNLTLTNISNNSGKVTEFFKPIIIQEFQDSFKLNVKSVVVSTIRPDVNDENYKKLIEKTRQREEQFRDAQAMAASRNQLDMQEINKDNYADALRIQREETQRRQSLHTQSEFLGAHQLNLQADVAKTAAESLGELGAGSGMDGGGGFNPAAMMTGMMMGGAVGSSMTNMMGNMTSGLNTPQPPTPPPGVVAEYHVVVNGQQAGPYSIEQLRQMMGGGTFTKDTYVWKNGMGNWDFAKNVPELSALFAAVPPPIPGGTPPVPPTLPNM